MANKIHFSKKVRVVIFFDGQRLKEVSFDQGPIQFGRLPTNDVHLDYPFISRSHFAISEDGDGFFLRDSGSRNGIVIDGVKQKDFRIQGSLQFKLDKLEIQIQILNLHDSQVKTQSDIQRAETIVQQTPMAPKVPQFQTPSALSAQPILQQDKTEVHIPKVNFSEPGGSPKASPLIPKAKPTPKTASSKSGGGGGLESHHDHMHGAPLVDRSFESELVELHPGLKSAPMKRLEAVVYWKDQVLQIREFEPQEKVTVGNGPFVALQLPVIPKGFALAKVEMDQAQCFIPKDKSFSVNRQGQQYTGQDLINNQAAKAKGNGIQFKMSQMDILNVDMGSDVRVFLRYVPATRPLPKKKLSEPDYAIKQALMGSAILHGILSLLLIIFAPTPKNVPKLKNVPERYARLLVEPPKPIIPVPEPPPPPPPPPEQKKEVAKPEPKKPEPKKIVKQEKPKKMELPKKLEKQNKFPMVVKNPMPNQPVAKVNNPSPTPVKEAPPVKVEALGALAALGPISQDPSPAPAMNNIKIDKNAGGLASKVANTQGIMGALPSPSGKLMAVGSGSVKTGGKGIGSGTAYGTQGLSGGAGTRAVAGGVVGQPKLATSSGKTEGLTRAQVMEVVQKHLAAVQACYEKSLLSNASLAGRMEFEWDIEASGSVSAVRIKRSTVSGGDALGSCVKGVFSAMVFPAAKNGQSTTPNIGFPFGRL